jgi:hypothetical protein
MAVARDTLEMFEAGFVNDSATDSKYMICEQECK